MKRNILVCGLAALLILFCFPSAAHAAVHTITTGGTYDISAYYASVDTLMISTTQAVTLTNTTSITATNFTIQCDHGAKLTLSGVTVDNSSTDDACPLTFTGSGNTLTLDSGTTNRLTGGFHEPGIRVESGTKLAIGGTGTLYTTGGPNGAGIGSGNSANSGDIAISDGTIIAVGKGIASAASGAGIGGGAGRDCGTVTVTGGNVTATGENGGAGIGGGYYGKGGTVTINGGTVTAKAQKIGADIGQDIGCGGYYTTAGGTLTVDGAATVTLRNTGTNAAVTLGDCYILDNSTASPIADGYYVNGTLFTGTIIDMSDGSIVGSGATFSGGTVTITNLSVAYLIKGTSSENNVKVSTGAYNAAAAVTLFGTSLKMAADDLCAFDMEDSKVDLELCGKNVLQSSSAHAGIQCPTTSTLSIQGNGSLTAQGGYGGAGIGGYDGTDLVQAGAGSITINGGTVTAKGGEATAGLGGANAGLNGFTLITGGTVYAIGGQGGAGIGSGNASYPRKKSNGSITISGSSLVYAQGGEGAQDIGKGNNGSGTYVKFGDTAAVFLRKDSYTSPDTGTHKHTTYSTDTESSYGYAIPSEWTPTFGSWLRLCTVSYNANNGSGTAPDAVTKLYNTPGTIADGSGLTRTGYENGGWNTQAGGLGTDYSGIYKFTQDLNLYVKWVPHTYMVKFNANSGSGSMADEGFAYGTAQALTQNTLTRKGYTFAGWALTADGTVQYADQASVTSLTDEDKGTVTLYAKWTPIDYTIVYHLDGGKATPDNPVSYNADQAITLVNPVKTGYAFDGWTGTEIKGKSMLVMIPKGSTENREYTASYLANGCTVKFSVNGGTPVADQAALYDGKVTKPADPTREGFVFTGWYADAAFAKPWNFSVDTVQGNTTLYAQWKSNGIHQIKAAASPTAGGKITGAGKYAGGKSVTLMAAPAKGYRFTKWTEGKKTVSQNAVYTFTAAKARALTACFAKIGVPSIASASSAGYNGAKLQWSKVTGAAGYNVYRSASKNGTYKKVASVKTASCVNSGLTCGKTYYYKVQAVCLTGKKMTTGALSAAKSVKPVPAAPTITGIVKKGADSVTVTYCAVAGASGYEIVRSADSRYYGYWYINTTGKTAYTNGSLKEGATYYYRVRAFRTVNGKKIYSGYSNIVTIKM